MGRYLLILLAMICLSACVESAWGLHESSWSSGDKSFKTNTYKKAFSGSKGLFPKAIFFPPKAKREAAKKRIEKKNLISQDTFF
jgi:hypothetical protein